MSKEELEKEAEENSFRYTLDKPWVCEVERKQIMAHFEKGYLAGAEPREKRIADLEETIANLKEQVQSQVEATIELDKENAELKSEKGCETCTKFDEVKLTKATALLKKFIETSNPIYFEEDRQKVKVEAEQFLRETDIDNAIQKANEGLDLGKIAEEVEQDIKEQKVK